MKDIAEKKRTLQQVLMLVRMELERAWEKHPGEFHNAHEGFAVLKEEVDELWDEVKADTAYTAAGMKEAVQTAAMAIRFVVELHNHPKSNDATAIDLVSEVSRC